MSSRIVISLSMWGAMSPEHSKDRFPKAPTAAAFSSIKLVSMSIPIGDSSSSESLPRENPPFAPSGYSGTLIPASDSTERPSSLIILVKIGSMSDFNTLQISEKYAIAVSLN
jgi:hypothetical protein